MLATLSRRGRGRNLAAHENHTPIGAFKLRGGIVYLDAVRRAQPQLAGVVTATRGNHGQSIAYAAARLGLMATIVVPHGNSVEKNRAMAGFGAHLAEAGHDFQAAYEHAVILAERERLHLVRSYDPLLVQGVASYALELFRAVADIDVVLRADRAGQGISGVIAARDALGLTTEIVGVVAAGAPAYALSLAAGAPVSTNAAETIADGPCRARAFDAAALEAIRRGPAHVAVTWPRRRRSARRCASSSPTPTTSPKGAGAAALAGRLRRSANASPASGWR